VEPAACPRFSDSIARGVVLLSDPAITDVGGLRPFAVGSGSGWPTIGVDAATSLAPMRHHNGIVAVLAEMPSIPNRQSDSISRSWRIVSIASTQRLVFARPC